MTKLALARAELIRWEELSIRYPEDKAVHKARERSWDAWWVAVRYWRLNVTYVQPE